MDCYGSANDGDVAGPSDVRALLEPIAAEHSRLVVVGDWLSAIREAVPDSLAVVQGVQAGDITWYVCSYAGDVEAVVSGPHDSVGGAQSALEALRRA